MEERELIAVGRRVIAQEAKGLQCLAEGLDECFAAAVKLVRSLRGHLVVTGLGKSGLIARKVAATLTSTGTAAAYMHPVEALHGDIGLVGGDDALLAFSKSGNTDELVRFVLHFRNLGGAVIAVTAAPRSKMAELASLVVPMPDLPEACPMNLAPTTSTAMMLSLGDALAMALVEARGFKPEDFARFHPEGSLGKRLLLRARDLMHTGAELPVVRIDQSLEELLATMTAKSLGLACIVEPEGTFLGVFTDGDLRRLVRRCPDPMKLVRGRGVPPEPPRDRGDQGQALHDRRGHAADRLPAADARQRDHAAGGDRRAESADRHRAAAGHRLGRTGVDWPGVDMKTLVVVQHCQSQHHVNRQADRWPDCRNGLTDQGQRQALCVGERLRVGLAGHSCRIYSSCMQRATETAAIISRCLGTEMRPVGDLHEWNGRFAMERTEDGPEWVVDNRNWSLFDWRPFAQAETWREFCGRTCAAMDRVVQDHPSECVAIVVTHGGTASNIVAWWLRLPLDVLPERTPFAGLPGGISVLAENAFGKPVIRRLNDTAHLEVAGLGGGFGLGA